MVGFVKSYCGLKECVRSTGYSEDLKWNVRTKYKRGKTGA